MAGLAATLATALWAMLPAYVPNSVAVLVGGGRPIDGGRTWRDGRRVLGDGKTWRGAAGGFLAGVATALVLDVARGSVALALPGFPSGAAVGLPAGAMAGDLAGSFWKRRTGRERGAPFPVVDQLGFVVGALAVAAVLAPGWLRATFTLPVLVAVVVVTPVVHLGTNAAAYALGLKDEPW